MIDLAGGWERDIDALCSLANSIGGLLVDRSLQLVECNPVLASAGGVKLRSITRPRSGAVCPPLPLIAWHCTQDSLSKTRWPRPESISMLAAASDGRMVTNPGGVLIRDAGGNVIGACGISGDTSDKDEMCAIAGIEAAGLKADPGTD